MKIRSLLLLIFFIFFSKISLSHEKSIVYIDLNKIMSNSIAGKSINSQLENNHKENISKFKNIEEEINDFFRLSRLIFFGKASKIDQSNAYNWLKDFSLHCRLCERKLIIEKNDLIRFNTPK